jgi:hypothetical protein
MLEALLTETCFGTYYSRPLVLSEPTGVSLLRTISCDFSTKTIPHIAVFFKV